MVRPQRRPFFRHARKQPTVSATFFLMSVGDAQKTTDHFGDHFFEVGWGRQKTFRPFRRPFLTTATTIFFDIAENTPKHWQRDVRAPKNARTIIWRTRVSHNRRQTLRSQFFFTTLVTCAFVPQTFPKAYRTWLHSRKRYTGQTARRGKGKHFVATMSGGHTLAQNS